MRSLEKYKHLLSRGDLKDLKLLESFSQSKGQSLEEIKPYNLYPIQKKWVKWAFSGGERLLLGARGYGKTETVIFDGLFEQIIKDPKTTCRIYSRNYEDAKDLLRVLGNMLKDYGKKGKFTETQIQLEENRKSKEPTVSLKSIMGRGHKGKHLHWAIFDDPVDLMDEFSPTLIGRVKKVYENLSSIADKGVIIVGQPVTENDLYDFLKKSLEENRVFEAWYGSIPDLDADMDNLRKTKSERFIMANYFGKMIPGETRPFTKIQTGDFLLKGYITAFLDPAYEGKDYTAITIGYKFYSGTEIKYYCYVIQERKGIAELQDTIILLCKKFNVTKLWVEKNADHGLGADLLRKKAIELGVKIYIEEHSNYKNKQHRIMSVIGPNIHNIILHKDSNCIDDIRLWTPQDKHDDHVDSLASFIACNS